MNTDGSFACICNVGYSGDGVSCQDIDECSAGDDGCYDNSACLNTDGSFTCVCNVGYSGHEVGLAISYAAAALGISSLERHITLDRAMYGSDQSASIEPLGLRQLVGAVRKIESAMGNGQKRILEAEVPIAKKLREHLDLDSNH